MKITGRWEKLGVLFSVDSLHPKLHSHAANPLPLHLVGDIYRFFYSARDKENRSSIGFVDIDIIKKCVVYTQKDPVLVHGGITDFYSHGLGVGCHASISGQRYIFFMGWQNHEGSHWRGDIGRVRLSQTSSPTLTNPELVLTLDEEDPISLSYPYIIHDQGIYKMWYGSTITWDAGNDEMIHVIKYATSVDGKIWHKHGLAVPYKLGFAQAFSRPVIIRNNGYNMWFSCRGGMGDTYRIGYSYSADGMNWSEPILNPGIETSKTGWDSEMIEYPFVFLHMDKLYMTYNGNSYGKTGFGLAVLRKST